MAQRVLTTHVGSLPRPQEVVDLVFALDRGEHVDAGEYDRVLAAAVRDRVERQLEAGIDQISDGEMSKIGYATYIFYNFFSVPYLACQDINQICFYNKIFKIFISHFR